MSVRVHLCVGVCGGGGDERTVFAVPELLSRAGVFFGLLAVRVCVFVRGVVTVLQHVVVL